MLQTASVRANASRRKYLRLFNAVAGVGAIGLFVFLIIRLFVLINWYSVDLVFWDQFNYYFAFTPKAMLFYHRPRPPTPWAMFVWQLGPHRLGLGMYLSWLTASLTQWNMRAEAFNIGGLLTLSALLGLALKWRLFGRLAWHDIVIPLLILTPVQYDHWADTPNPAHRAIPLVLLLSYCLIWTISSRPVRYPLLLLVNFFMIFTGFGIFMGLITPVLLAVHLWQAIQDDDRNWAWWNGVALPVALACGALYFRKYRFDPANPDFRFPAPNWYLYPEFIALSFARACGTAGRNVGAVLIGWSAMLATVAALLHHARNAIRAPSRQTPSAKGPSEDGPSADGPSGRCRRPRATSLVIVILAGFSLLFAANMAVGRISLGLIFAQASRYVTLINPALIAVYFAALRIRMDLSRTAAVTAVMVIACFSGLHAKQADLDWMDYYRSGKTRWIYWYSKSHQLRIADALSDMPVEGSPPPPFLQQKLDYMEHHKLSCFRDEPTTRPAGRAKS